MANLIEYMRQKSVEKLFGMASFSHNWNNMWQQNITERLGQNFTPRDVLNLGDSLGDIFRSTGVAGRGQDEVSAAGHTWEALVCWYLNICLAGSRVVVFKQSKEMIPEPLRDSMTVLYGNFPSNTEADLIAVTFPNIEEYTSEIENLSDNTLLEENGIQAFTNRGRFKFKEILNVLSERDFDNYEINVIQCKTNWNDNAQIPMLWDMIYRAEGFAEQITVGRNGYNINRLNRFTYSFVTVPTVRRDIITENSTQVKRVINLSGGNFWGYPTSNNIAQSIKEIINRNYRNGTNHNVLTSTLPTLIAGLNNEYNYFNI
jgi:hypothetical protein